MLLKTFQSLYYDRAVPVDTGDQPCRRRPTANRRGGGAEGWMEYGDEPDNWRDLRTEGDVAQERGRSEALVWSEVNV